MNDRRKVLELFDEQEASWKQRAFAEKVAHRS